MRVVHLVTYAGHGGAGIAARRLHNSLLQHGIDSWIICIDVDENKIIALNPLKLLGKYPSLLYRYYRTFTGYSSFVLKKHREIQYSTNGRKNCFLLKKINELKPDIIHIHWINDGFIDLRQLPKLQIPIVWSCHDMWPFSGGCHYDSNCNKWMSSCVGCPILDPLYLENEANAQLILKRKIYHEMENIHFIGLSSWMYNCLKQSAVASDLKISCIPNTIDEKSFIITPKCEARKRLNIQDNARIILFGAMDLSDARKGFQYLVPALAEIGQVCNISAIAVGKITGSINQEARVPIKFWGAAKNKDELSLLYSAADVVVIPSIQENLSNMIIEAQLCGTPVAAFDIGGNKDMIRHMKTGFLTDSISSNGLRDAILWCLSNSISQVDIRRHIMDEFDNQTTIKKYVDLYNNITKK